ncbi:hypothetical protein ARMGADRAFT_1013716 [Armillaria gallica]|uniref:Uncharacterized protein n=1 Tax=Armillaria gallica TaxID=47427 RepID=A0A2H3DDS3_ARMGA|nr:hypothetical protein ARMGADRAFT_1013716 [Armillaria gallica]
MFFPRILLFLPIALVVGNPLFGRSEITALQAAFVSLNTTFYNFHQACNSFAIDVDHAHSDSSV